MNFNPPNTKIFNNKINNNFLYNKNIEIVENPEKNLKYIEIIEENKNSNSDNFNLQIQNFSLNQHSPNSLEEENNNDIIISNNLNKKKILKLKKNKFYRKNHLTPSNNNTIKDKKLYLNNLTNSNESFKSFNSKNFLGNNKNDLKTEKEIFNNFQINNNNNSYLTSINNSYYKDPIDFKNNNLNNKNNAYSEYMQNTREIQEYFFNPNKSLLQMDICEQIKFLLKQFDFFLQLIIQNIFLTDDPDLKYRCYLMIYNLYLQRIRVMSMFKLPEFEISFNFTKVKKLF